MGHVEPPANKDMDELVEDVVTANLYGLTLQKSSQRFRKIACRISSFQNLFCALVESCRLSCWEGFREKKWMACSTYASVMFKLWDDHYDLHSAVILMNPPKD